jgi:hypothetical protein
LVHTSEPPSAIAPIASVTISGWTASRWQIQPLAAPIAMAMTATTATAGSSDQP